MMQITHDTTASYVLKAARGARNGGKEVQLTISYQGTISKPQKLMTVLLTAEEVRDLIKVIL